MSTVCNVSGFSVKTVMCPCDECFAKTLLKLNIKSVWIFSHLLSERVATDFGALAFGQYARRPRKVEGQPSDAGERLHTGKHTHIG